MNATRSIFQFILFFATLAVLPACGGTPTPQAPTASIEVKNISEGEVAYHEIKQTKIINQCDSASSFKAQIQFSESSGESSEQELVLGASVTGGADISGVAKVELEGSIEQHFSRKKNTGSSYQENVSIEVPAFTQQGITIIWREKRQEGTVEYVENGETRHVNYSYRVGLDLASSTATDIPCYESTETPVNTATPSPTATPTSLPPKPIAQGCISSQTWKAASSNSLALDTISIHSDGCYGLEALGMYADGRGVLHMNLSNQKNAIASGIYTPINNDTVIEFKVFINSMYLVYPERPLTVNFAVAPADKPMAATNTARFNLLIDKTGNQPWIYFVMADPDEVIGFKLDTQHYEYGRTYTLRIELEGNTMRVFINNLEMNERLYIPIGQKVFYVGYNLPIQAGVDAEVRDIKVDGQFK